MPQEKQNAHRKKQGRKRSAAKNAALWVIEIIAALLIAFVLVYCVGMQTTVVGNSMESTLEDGNRVLVNRFIYTLSSPKSGDVVVFLPNGNTKSHYYIKRVVGVPGDTVQIIDGVLYVNGEVFDEQDTDSIETAGLAEDPVVVGEREYFVIGDNRNSSEDSRYVNLGNVSKDDIVGKVWFVIQPFDEIGWVK